jgi:tRNA uridine 5-carboxymethylaminomethyl modification enzyme
MIDDLVTRGVTEPYRMFTSRAEFRLHLRADNADQRLSGLGISRGIVGDERRARFEAKQRALSAGRVLLDTLKTTPTVARKAGIAVNADGQERSAFDVLSYPDVTAADATRIWPEIEGIEPAILDQLTIDAQYAVYLDRQRADIEAVKRDEAREIPEWLDYAALPGLSIEVRQKLQAARPSTLAQAQAVNGVTPAAIPLLPSVIRRGHMRKAG